MPQVIVQFIGIVMLIRSTAAPDPLTYEAFLPMNGKSKCQAPAHKATMEISGVRILQQPGSTTPADCKTTPCSFALAGGEVVDVEGMSDEQGVTVGTKRPVHITTVDPDFTPLDSARIYKHTSAHMLIGHGEITDFLDNGAAATQVAFDAPGNTLTITLDGRDQIVLDTSDAAARPKIRFLNTPDGSMMADRTHFFLHYELAKTAPKKCTALSDLGPFPPQPPPPPAAAAGRSTAKTQQVGPTTANADCSNTWFP